MEFRDDAFSGFGQSGAGVFLDAQQWAAVSSAEFPGIEVRVPANFFRAKRTSTSE
jgi:hypothetical protein